MRDPRIEILAKNLVRYSCAVQPGENVLIENTGLARELVAALVEQVYAAEGLPFVQLHDPAITRQLLLKAEPEQLDKIAAYESMRMEQMDAYIGIRSGDNSAELSDVPQEQLNLYNIHVSDPVHGKIRVPTTKWVVLRYPNAAMAQQANTSTEAFESFYFDVCNLDYRNMSRAMDALVERMQTTDQVHIKGPGTDLTFSIRNIPAIKCDGRLNIPDGEVFTAPVKDSVNGTIAFNTPSLYQGFTFTDVSFTFRDGQIVQAAANNTSRLEKVLATDAGARFIGEFAIGLNPFILEPMKDTLFDEKIAGSFHFTPGQSYDEAFNGNKSSVHWDLVCIQRPEYGGGQIFFDQDLIRQDGLFIPEDLLALNPESLRKA